MGKAALELDWRVYERRLRRRDSSWQTSGGVVVDPASGRVLLVKNRRERREGYRGWTWPKGVIDPGEGPVTAALREIAEEAGTVAEPLLKLVTLETKRALRHYFLLALVRDGMPLHRETKAVRWVSLRKARKLLDRKRDLRVLRAAERALDKLGRRGRAPELFPLLSLAS